MVTERVWKTDKTSKKMTVLFIIAFSLLVYAVVFQTCTPRSFSDDDWGIANYFAGVLGAEYATPYNKFINIILGWIMYGLYQHIPGPNWFVVIEQVIIIVSFIIFHYLLIHKLDYYLKKRWSYLLSSVILLCFEPTYFCHVQFSQTAIVGSISGMLFIGYSYKNKFRFGIIAGIVLSVISCLYRNGGFEVVLPYMLLILMKTAWNDKIWRSGKETLKGYMGLLSIYAALTVFCFGTAMLNQSIYNSEYYAEYNAFNSARASVLDYPKAPYDEIKGGLDEIGVSSNDYTLITGWAFADQSFITTELLKQIAILEPKIAEKTDNRTQIIDYFNKLKDTTLQYNRIFYVLLFCAVILALIDFYRSSLWLLFNVCGTVVIEIYFTVWVERYPSYIRSGVLYAAIMTALLMVEYSRLKNIFNRNWMINSAICAALLVICFPNGNRYYLDTKGTFEYESAGLDLYHYFAERETDVFIIPTGNNGGMPALRNSYSIFRETESGIMRHTVGLGGWSTNMPWINEAYSSWGIDYPMRQVADENVYVLTSYGFALLLRQYVREHCNYETSISLEAYEYGTTIYKITNLDLAVEELKKIGRISNVVLRKNEELMTYDVNVDFEMLNEGFKNTNLQVYLKLTDETGDYRYYMFFGGHALKFDGNVSSLTAKIPQEELEVGSYSVSIIFGQDNEFYENDDIILNLVVD